MANTKKTLGEKLRELRESYDLSQAQVAEALNIERSTYSNYELDRTQPNLETLVRLARIFNVPKGSLLPDDEDEATSFRDAICADGMLNSLTKDERGLVIRYRAMNSSQKDILRTRIIDEITNIGEE